MISKKVIVTFSTLTSDLTLNVCQRMQEGKGLKRQTKTDNGLTNIVWYQKTIHPLIKPFDKVSIYLTQHHSHHRARGGPHGHCHHTLHSLFVLGPHLLFPLGPLQASVLWSEWNNNTIITHTYINVWLQKQIRYCTHHFLHIATIGFS